MIELPPGLILIVGAFLVPFFHGNVRNIYMLLLPIFGIWGLLTVSNGVYFPFEIFGYNLSPVRIDRLSLLFGYIFHIAAIISLIYAFHLKDTVQQMAGLIYAGAAIGGAFAGDLITLFIYWEITAIASVFLIWSSRTEASFKAGMRYLIIQVGSGVLLLAGAIIHFHKTGSIVFDKMNLSGLGPILIFIAFGIKAAFPLLHNWLSDAYPEATVTGTVFLSAFTTKCAVYVLARGFPGTDLLIYIGAAMALFPVFYAIIENDFRRLLAYALNQQLGFMVIGIGIGTTLAINGAVAHAFVSTLYKALLFMSMGAVLYRVGTVKGSELGGLYRSMPLTTVFCIIGAASISAFPLFSGFIAKSLILSAVAYEGYLAIWMILLVASVGAFFHSGIKVPYYTFFAQDSGKRCKEAPLNMLIAMGITAILCIAIGAYSPWLYSLLPYPVKYIPYTTSHVIGQYQLLIFAALAFAVLIRFKIYPPNLKSVNLDFDITYRKWIPAVYRWVITLTRDGWQSILQDLRNGVQKVVQYMFRHHGPEGILARTWPTGSMALWVAVLLGGILLIYYV